MPETQKQNEDAADYKTCTVALIGLEISSKSDNAAEEIKEVTEDFNKYLEEFGFTKPGVCPNCSAPLGGFMGSFRWGIAHGEGQCFCGWPCRAYHRPNDRRGEQIFKSAWNIILPYHRDNVQ